MRDVSLEEVCPGIRHRFRLVEAVAGSYRPPMLVVSFSGEYRLGSSGNPDAAFMRGVVALACEVWDCRGLVIDLECLAYEWGDEIDSVFGHPQDRSIPTAVVVGPRCRRALATLWFGEETDRDATEEEWAFDRLEDAVAYVEDRDPYA